MLFLFGKMCNFNISKNLTSACRNGGGSHLARVHCGVMLLRGNVKERARYRQKEGKTR